MNMVNDSLLGRLDLTALGFPRFQAAARAGNRAPVADRLRTLIYSSPFYPLCLLGPAPDRLALQPPDPWPGDAARGDELFQGKYRFAGHEVSAPKMPVWLPAGIDDAWIEEMHAFEWLRDFKASGGEAARRYARALVRDWIRHCGHWRPISWRADILGRRIAAWSMCGAFLLHGADDSWRAAFLSSLAMQIRHLGRAVTRETSGAARISAVRGLLYGALCLGPSERRTNHAIRLMIRECKRQVLGDGGHIERSPHLQRRVLGDLADCRALLLAANRVPPEDLTRTIDRMAPLLRALCHGDGGLAMFNDTGEDDATSVETTLALANVRSRALVNASQSGFQRLAHGPSTVIIDSGAPDPRSPRAHAGMLSFEMSVGDHRMIVNCGPHAGRGAQWSRALRSTAAHSTLVLTDTNSMDFDDDGRVARQPLTVRCERNESDGAAWVDAQHDGYAKKFGLIHRRRFYLNADGDDLRGEDSLSPATGVVTPEPQPFAIRFHLHPSVQASLVMHGHAALFRLPDGSGWQLRAVGGSLAINPSIYFGRNGERRRSEQAVIVGVCGAEGTTVKWAIHKIGS
jgi:uncharacterized heparinase superfamily protein